MGALKNACHDDLERQRCAEEGEYENEWVPALTAFYRADGSTTRAESLRKGWRGLDNIDLRTIAALQAAIERAPRAA